MKRYTSYQIKDKEPLITYHNHVSTLGSCFSERMGEKLSDCQFKLLRNPLGTLYHPIIIFNHINYALNANPLIFLENKYLRIDGYYFNFQNHSTVFGKSIEEYQSKYIQKLQGIRKVLQKNGTIIITLGTAWAYHIKNDKNTSPTHSIVGNCHKQKADLFERRLTEIQDVVDSFSLLASRLQRLNYHPQIIFTLSPVRHLKDGFEGNSLSKSYCRVAIDKICKKFDNCHYFPAFEILMDELRDYRYYESDLLHPTPFAEEIIWNYFIATYMTSEDQKVIFEWKKIQAAMNHRPLFPVSTYVDFLTKTQQRLQFFENYFDITPFVNELEQRKFKKEYQKVGR